MRQEGINIIKAVIFDMDGVLIDSEALHHKALNSTMAVWHITIYDEEYDGYVGSKTIDMCRKLVTRYHLPVTPEQLAAQKTRKLLEEMKGNGHLQSIRGVAEFIADLYRHGVLLAVASSSYLEVIDTVLAELGLRNYFRAVVSGDQVSKGKPDPEIFLEACARLGVPPAECAVVEDSANGVRAAKAAGMFCIGFVNPGSGEQDLSPADMVVDDFAAVNYQRIAGRENKDIS